MVAPLPRRALLAGFAASAAIIAPAAASTAVTGLPTASPDAELIALGHDLETRWQAEQEATCSSACAAACARTSAVVRKIEAVPATTLAGLAVKLRAVAWCMEGEEITAEALFGQNPTTETRLIAAMLRDVQTMTQRASA